MKVTRLFRSLTPWLLQPASRTARWQPPRNRPLIFEREEERAMLTGTPAISIGVSSPIIEGDGMYVTLWLSEPSDQVVSVTVNIDHVGGGPGGDDWPFASTSIWFAPWETGYYGSWASIDDSLIEGDEDFIFSLANPINATLGYQPSSTMTLIDNDLPSTVEIDVTALDEILANGQVDEAEGFRVTGMVFDPSPTLSEVLLKMDLNFDGDTDDDGEEVEAALTPWWYTNYWTFSVDVAPIPDDGFSSAWGNETPSDMLMVTALLTDADSNQIVSAAVDVEVFNVAPQLSDPLISYELDSQGYVVSASITGTFDDPGFQDYHQLAVTWAVDSGFSGQEPILLPLGERAFSITRLFESSSETEVEDLYPIVIDVTDDDSGADAFVAVGNRERYKLTYSIEDDADEDGEQPALLHLVLDKPAPAGGITVTWEPILLPGEDPASKDIAQASDFHNAVGTWTFAEGQTQKTIELKPVDDEIVEKNEKMKITMPWVTTDDYVVTTTGTGFLGHWSTTKILDDEWRFVNPDNDYFEIDASGSWHSILENVLDEDKWVWYLLVPIGRFTGHARVGYDGFDGVQALSEASIVYGGNTGVDSAFRTSQMKFTVHSQTGDIVRNNGTIITGNSVDDAATADIGYNWAINNFGPNEKQVNVTYQVAFGYEADISATGTIGEGISISFTSGATEHKYGVEDRQLSLVARNRVADDNTGLEWQD